MSITSPTTNCNQEKYQGFHQVGHKWFTSDGRIHVSHIPYEIIWHANWNSYTFSAPALFHNSHNIQSAQSVNFIRSYIFRTSVLEHQVDRLVNYTARLSLSPEVIAQFLKGTGQLASEYVQGVSNATGNLLTSSSNSILHAAETLVAGPTQIIINLVIIIIIIAILIYIFYYLRTFFSCCHITKLFQFGRQPAQRAPTPKSISSQNSNQIVSNIFDSSRHCIPDTYTDHRDSSNHTINHLDNSIIFPKHNTNYCPQTSETSNMLSFQDIISLALRPLVERTEYPPISASIINRK